MRTQTSSAVWTAILIAVLALQLSFASAAAIGQETAVADSESAEVSGEERPNPAKANDGDRPRPVEKARRTYMGRIVAQPMSHLGAGWLVRPERNDEENAEESFERLGLKPGMTIVDLGCGNGYWTIPMARAVAVKPASEDASEVGESEEVASTNPASDESLDGTVLAVDIQREMLQKLRQNMIRNKVENIQPILGSVDDPNLPADQVDLVLLVDVYHEFSHPESMLWNIRRSLKSDGVIALLEYRAEDPQVPIKPLHKMTKAQIMKEYEASGLKLVREYNELPWQHLMFFARDDSPLETIEPKPFQTN
ncbi:methyltransferase domain-containing protein [Rhodopirellula sp. JC740]|uniref:Methyltransferase domain-containing protein n=1 Tax=Rhodopirellula halodulae TaxID=2894198 RepID=A0ABS8NDR4_9BACT|nr:class I SAM-dependent methyltransferase [Rhodopirellula sp. JC740]MCC9640963.1 methyltransferase domain-containing protein [Rhodopirellula sp. JC740]